MPFNIGRTKISICPICFFCTTPKTTKITRSSSKSATHHSTEQHAQTAIIDCTGAYQAFDRITQKKHSAPIKAEKAQATLFGTRECC